MVLLEDRKLACEQVPFFNNSGKYALPQSATYLRYRLGTMRSSKEGY